VLISFASFDYNVPISILHCSLGLSEMARGAVAELDGVQGFLHGWQPWLFLDYRFRVYALYEIRLPSPSGWQEKGHPVFLEIFPWDHFSSNP
jgi:hypothetical protein